MGEDLVLQRVVDKQCSPSNFLFAISTPSTVFYHSSFLLFPVDIPGTRLARINLAHTNSSLHKEVYDTVRVIEQSIEEGI